jgi:hypothetical protein
MKGVAFASMRSIDLMQSRGCHLDRMAAAFGRAKTRLWLEIKASIYDCPFWPPARRSVVCSVGRCVRASRLGFFSNLESVVSELVRYDGEIAASEPGRSDTRRRNHAPVPSLQLNQSFLPELIERPTNYFAIALLLSQGWPRRALPELQREIRFHQTDKLEFRQILDSTRMVAARFKIRRLKKAQSEPATR